MFDINLAEKLYKISFKTLPLKIQWSKGRQRGTVCPPQAVRVNKADASLSDWLASYSWVYLLLFFDATDILLTLNLLSQ